MAKGGSPNTKGSEKEEIREQHERRKNSKQKYD